MFTFWRNSLIHKSPQADARRSGKKRPDSQQAARRAPTRPWLEELETRLVPAGSWTSFVHQAPAGLGTMFAMPDGSIMAQQAGVSNQWFKLTPGPQGDPATYGTWSSLASMGRQRLYFGSNILHDGRVFVMGGEYSGSSGSQDDTNTGEIYDTSTNTWGNIANFPQSKFGDDPTVLLDNGQILCGYILGTQTYLYNPVGNTWTQTGSKLHSDRSDEETWLKLPDGSVLSYDVFNDVDNGHSTAQRYVPSTGQWVDAGTVPVDLSSSTLGDEMGGATLLPDGRAWFVGATGHTAFYTPSTNSWTAGPDLPNGQHADDAPLCALINGNVLVAADGPGATFSPPTHIYEFDPIAKTYTEVDPPPLVGNNSVKAFNCRMLTLFTGQVVLEENQSSQLYAYATGLHSGPQPGWLPAISGISAFTGFSLQPEVVLTGTQLNGLSAGASYGDDAEMDSNYTIVEYQDSSFNWHYAQPFDRSSNGVQTGSTLVSTSYLLPPGISDGAYWVWVSTNGIISKAILNVLMDSSLNNVTLEVDPLNNGLYDVFSGSTLLSQWAIDGFQDPFPGITAVDVTMENSGGTVNIKSTPANVPVNVYGGGASTIVIGNSSSVQGIQGPINLENAPNYNTVYIDDSFDRTTRNVTLSSVTNTTILNGSTGLSGQLSGLAPAPIIWKYADTARVVIQGGTGADTWNVLGIGADTSIVASDADTINVGNAGSVQGITGTLNLENPHFYNTVNINDAADAVTRLVNIATLASNPDDYAILAEPWGQITGLAPGIINFEYADTASVRIETGLGVNNVINVRGTGVTTDIVSRWFGTTVNVGNSGSLASILGTLNIENSVNPVNLNIDDSSDTIAHTVALSNIGPNPDDSEGNDDDWGQVSGLAPASINYEYGDTNNLTLSLGNAANTVNILETGGTGTTTFNVPTRTTFNVGDSGSTSGIVSPLALNDSSASSFLTVNDAADTATQTVTVTSSSVTGMTPAAINFTANDLTSITLDGTSGPDSYIVTAMRNGHDLTINAGAGNNNLTVGNSTDGLGDFTGLIDFVGGIGQNAVTIDDRANSSSTISVIRSGQFERGFGYVNFSGVQKLIVNAGNGGNEIAILDTPVTLTVTVNAGSGGDNVHAGGSLVGTVDSILGPVTVNGQGSNTSFTVFDQSNTAVQTYTVTTTSVKRTGGFATTIANLKSVTVNGSSGGDTYNVESSAVGVPVTINGGAGNDTINLSPNAHNLTNLAALVTVNGGGGNNVLRVNDQNAPAAESYSVTPSAVSRPGSAGVSYSAINSVSVNGGSHGNTFTVSSATSVAMTLNAGTGTDTLVGPNADSTWTINSAGGGKVGLVSFSHFEKIVGGSGMDVFKLTSAGSLTGSLDGGAAPLHKGNWLDYSGLTTAVIVNLKTGSATGIAAGATGKVANIQDVHGGDGGNTLTGNSLGNILIGGNGADTIKGGTGASLLIGHKGIDHVTGGSGGDILIGDSTTFDSMTTANENSLMSILAEWQSADSYATRFHDINTGTGGGLNGPAKLNFGTTVVDDGSADTVTAAASAQALDWFFQGAGDTLHNVETGEHINNN
jgi:hypothetical protein